MLAYGDNVFMSSFYAHTDKSGLNSPVTDLATFANVYITAIFMIHRQWLTYLNVF